MNIKENHDAFVKRVQREQEQERQEQQKKKQHQDERQDKTDAILKEIRDKKPQEFPKSFEVSNTITAKVKKPDWYKPTKYDDSKVREEIKSVKGAIDNIEIPKPYKEVSIKKPSWYKPIVLTELILEIRKIPKHLVELKEKIWGVKVLNRPEVVLTDKEGKEIDLSKMNKTIVAGGGGGLSSADSEALRAGATEAKQDDILTELQKKADNDETQPVSMKKFVTNEIYGNGTDTYFCKENEDGAWYIMKIDKDSVFTHATEANNATVTSYADARTNVTTLTYGTYNQAF